MRLRPFLLAASTTLVASASVTGCAEGDTAPPPQGLQGSGQGAGGAAGSGGSGGEAGLGKATGGASQGGTGGKGVIMTGGSSQGGAAQGGMPQGGSGQQGGSAQGGNAQGGEAQGGSAQGGSAQGGSAQGGDGQGGNKPFEGKCPTTFSFTLPPGASNARVAGAWNNFDLATATPLSPGDGGKSVGTVDLPPGLHAYKIIYDQGGQEQWVLDPEQGRRKYDGAIENSAVKVRDCSLPTYAIKASTSSRPAKGQGAYSAELGFVAGLGGGAVDKGKVTATLTRDGETTPLASEITIDDAGDATISLSGLDDGKYRVTVTAASTDGKVGEPVRLVFWIEAEAFSWEDALIYMVMTDRFRDGDPSNNAAPISGADPRGDFMGGDLEGLRQAIADGTLDKLGVRAIWLTPFQTNPTSAFPASDGVHQVTGYHGYWPVKAREVDPRLGGASALHDMVREAHRHGIRILQDYVVNHVHEQHEYFSAHPEWFRTGCVCGTSGCDWTERALDCLFASYMPDINHTVPEANAQFVADAVYWLDEFDLDGLRVDAVKHVEEIATRNLAVEVRETFEGAGTRYFMMGETAMGWSDCPDPCNDGNYGTISKYIGPYGLDGQFDFVLYHGVSYNTFAYGDKGLLHADYWVQHGLEKWPKGSIMTPYIGSHDTARFVSLADYRGQDGAHGRGVPGNQWDNIAQAPADDEPYARLRVAMAWMLGLPGAPLMYYGDEYGQWGGADPNNRVMMKAESALDGREKATLDFVRKMGTARQTVRALRRGAYVSMGGSEDALVMGRKADDGAALVAINRASSPVALTVDAQAKLGLGPGTALTDALGGQGASVDPSGKLIVTIPARGAAVLAP